MFGATVTLTTSVPLLLLVPPQIGQTQSVENGSIPWSWSWNVRLGSGRENGNTNFTETILFGYLASSKCNVMYISKCNCETVNIFYLSVLIKSVDVVYK